MTAMEMQAIAPPPREHLTPPRAPQTDAPLALRPDVAVRQFLALWRFELQPALQKKTAAAQWPLAARPD